MLKAATTKALTELMAPIQEAFQASEEWKDIIPKAYPPPPAKVKKVKDRGTGYPGAKKADIVVPQPKTDQQREVVNETSA